MYFSSLKEIVEEMKKELHKVKDEIINGELWCEMLWCHELPK